MASPRTATRNPKPAIPVPGVFFVIVGPDGLWLRLTFLRFADGLADVGIFATADGTEIQMSIDQVRRQAPRTVQVHKPSVPSVSSVALLSPAQRSAIFAVARSRGLDLDDIRALCPKGHVSTLTRGQAAALIDRLDGRPGHREHRDHREGLLNHNSSVSSVAPGTPAQLAFAADLAAGAGLDRRDLARWLHRRYGVDSLADESLTRRDLNKIIGAFRSMRRKRERPSDRSYSSSSSYPSIPETAHGE